MAETTKKRKLMVVEDDEYINDLMKYLLAVENNYELIVLPDGKNAVKIAEEEQPALIFIDYMLPHVNGVDICKRLGKNERTSSIPRVLMSATSKINEIDKESLGVKQVLSKPFAMNEVIRIIESLIGK